MHGPPIPSFEPYSCPNCGLPLRELVEFCPACGARTDNAKRKPQWLSCLMMTILAFFMVPLGLAGACFLVSVALADVSLGPEGFYMSAIGLVLLIAAVLCGIAIVKLSRK